MYCIKCGVELSDSEEKCPLCGTVVFHPDVKRVDGEKPYPAERKRRETANTSAVLFVLTMLFVIPLVMCLLCDFKVNDRIVWSGYASGAIVLFYIVVVLPMWFKRATPVIFVAADFAAAILYLLYIDLAVGGGWFMPFAFPVAGGMMLISCAALLSAARGAVHNSRNAHRHGRLYGAGGAASEQHLRPEHKADMVSIPAGGVPAYRHNAYNNSLLPQA